MWSGGRRGVGERDFRQVDESVAREIAALPVSLRRLIDEIPIVILDEPTPEMLRDLGIDPSDGEAREEICGLHTGIPMTEDSVEYSGDLPTTIHLFRRGLVNMALDERGRLDRETLDEEVRITILHELGHHFGLEEGDLDDLGYG